MLQLINMYEENLKVFKGRSFYIVATNQKIDELKVEFLKAKEKASETNEEITG